VVWRVVYMTTLTSVIAILPPRVLYNLYNCTHLSPGVKGRPGWRMVGSVEFKSGKFYCSQ
jgi:hypothetical protein